MRAGVSINKHVGSVAASGAIRNSSSAIVLAGGEGLRMRPLIKSWLREERPKQYCTYCGSRSMLQHTVDRALSIATVERLVTVIGHGHQAFLGQSVPADRYGRVIEQPMDRGTAPAIFLALANILETDPAATVLILPCDLFVHPEDQFLRYAHQACQMAEFYTDQIILLGAIPDRPETEYGWVEPAAGGRVPCWQDRGRSPIPVKSFHEKPSRKQAEMLLDHGGLWNTMVIAAKAKALWALGWAFLPEMMGHFETFRNVLRAIREGLVSQEHATIAMTHLYHRSLPTDFSRAILERAGHWCRILAMEGLHWCDWGHPERVRETLDWLGVKPAFPLVCLEEQKAS